jgi:hypothetical protein
MVRALLAGHKTQTRRRLKAEMPARPTQWDCVHEPKHDAPYLDAYCGGQRSDLNPRGMTEHWCWWTRDNRPGAQFKVGCKPGDLLWVRETWRTAKSLDDRSPSQIAAKAIEAGYRQPWAPIRYEADGADCNYRESDWGPWGKTRVAIHMPFWASRLTLRLQNVRVEKVGDISEDDAEAEGIDLWVAESIGCGCPASQTATEVTYGSRRQAFAHLWDTIHGTDAFDGNPWCTPLTFAVHRCNVNEMLNGLEAA